MQVCQGENDKKVFSPYFLLSVKQAWEIKQLLITRKHYWPVKMSEEQGWVSFQFSWSGPVYELKPV